MEIKSIKLKEFFQLKEKQYLRKKRKHAVLKPKEDESLCK
jgi:hypothetical protein